MTSYIVKIKGHQYRVKKGEELLVDKLQAKKGDKIEFNQVLLIKTGGEDIKIGKPYVKDAKVKAEVIDHVKGPKVEMVKFKKKKRYLKRKGHRQEHSKIKIL